MAAVNSILQVENLTKSFGDLVLFENISLGLSEGQRVGLIAKNGSGKTTLLNILSGKEGYDNGTISFRRDLRVGYLEQDPQYPEELTVLEACFHHGNSTVELIKEYERCMETDGHPGLDGILARMDHEKAWEYEQKAKQTDYWSHFNATYAKYVRIEYRFRTPGTGHKDEPDDYNRHPDGQQNKIHLVESKISFIHKPLFIICFLFNINHRPSSASTC